MILYFYSLKYLNVGDSLVIVCSSPIFVFIIGYLFLGESCGVIPVITILLSMAGVSVITRPPMLTGKESFETDDMVSCLNVLLDLDYVSCFKLRHLQKIIQFAL